MLATSMYPNARENEVNVLLDEISSFIDIYGEESIKVLESGTGEGNISREVYDFISQKVQVDFHSTDPVEKHVTHAKSKYFNEESSKYKIYPENDRDSYQVPYSFDLIYSIAQFHHFDNRDIGTGFSERINCLTHWHNILDPEGQIIIIDVADNTSTQRYFDAIDDPIYVHPDGHPHDFLTEESARNILCESGFKLDSWKVVHVPWIFDSIESLIIYMSLIHNSRAKTEDLMKVIEGNLGVPELVNGKFSLNWELFVLNATKSDHP